MKLDPTKFVVTEWYGGYVFTAVVTKEGIYVFKLPPSTFSDLLSANLDLDGSLVAEYPATPLGWAMAMTYVNQRDPRFYMVD